MWTLIIYLSDDTSISEDFEVMSQAEIRVNKIMQSGFKGKQGDKTIYYPLHIIKKMEIIPKS